MDITDTAQNLTDPPFGEEHPSLRIGVVGAGAFAAFAVESFLEVPGVSITGVTDINETTGRKMAIENHATFYVDLEGLLTIGDPDLVYIATPPYLHYSQTKQALLMGKHVICEKPAALQAIEARELLALANSRQLLYIVNLMQRYNPLYATVKKIIDQQTLGNFLHGYFENYASDENLAPGHWFWDATKSGGIFIEHGVHFFDMFSGWFGAGKVVNAITMERPVDGIHITDRVQATVVYNDAPVSFYHGFDQPGLFDRQELRLLFERGEITLYEWIPVKMKLHALVNNEQLQCLQELTGQAELLYNGNGDTKNKKATGRFKAISFDHEITMLHGDPLHKQNRYRQLLTSMLTDQWQWIQDRSHERVIDGNNAVASLQMAETATKISRKF